MKKLQVWKWFLSGFFKKHKKIILVGIFLGIALSIFLIWILPYIPRPNMVTRVGLIGQYRKNALPEFISQKVSQGLTTQLSDCSVAPVLATDWAVSQDGKVYTFFLRDDVYWQDGLPFTAKDIQLKFSDVTTKVLDDHTIQFVLKEEFTPFPLLLSKPLLKNDTIGTGEFKIRSITEKGGYVDQIRLESKKETYIVQFFSNIKAAKTAFKLGEVDELVGLYQNPLADEPDWSQAVDIESTRETNQYLALFLNNKDGMLVDKSFRQALAYATQKPMDSNRALGPISVDSWAFNPDVKPYNYDPQRAKELLEKSLGSLDRAKKITLHLATTQQFLDEADKIKTTWEHDLGIHVDVKIINSLSEDYQVLLASQEIPPDPDQYSLWHSTQDNNFINLQNPRIDKLLEDGRKELDQKKRKEIYYDFQKFFMEESPVIFLYYPQVLTIKRKSVIKPFILTVLESKELRLGR
ncbi:hypothetical protein GYA49_06455 [Candidatus Beckwithbacteria bacterium]|nr:hypothetical protein [Candidatus Beckwithbacteria bacterium]